ncbi:hypothetical protein M758_10G113500 [Ceratodon purpureus]|nr:hypothetical protein M758_10G113500 [Ceratodon purpureus]
MAASDDLRGYLSTQVAQLAPRFEGRRFAHRNEPELLNRARWKSPTCTPNCEVSGGSCWMRFLRMA